MRHFHVSMGIRAKRPQNSRLRIASIYQAMLIVPRPPSSSLWLFSLLVPFSLNSYGCRVKTESHGWRGDWDFLLWLTITFEGLWSNQWASHCPPPASKKHWQSDLDRCQSACKTGSCLKLHLAKEPLSHTCRDEGTGCKAVENWTHAHFPMRKTLLTGGL